MSHASPLVQRITLIRDPDTFAAAHRELATRATSSPPTPAARAQVDSEIAAIRARGVTVRHSANSYNYASLYVVTPKGSDMMDAIHARVDSYLLPQRLDRAHYEDTHERMLDTGLGLVAERVPDASRLESLTLPMLPLASDMHYAACLHEFGHIHGANVGPTPRSEPIAARWAVDNALYWNAIMTESSLLSLWSYVVGPQVGATITDSAFLEIADYVFAREARGQSEIDAHGRQGGFED